MEDLIDSFWVWLLIAFLAGEILGMIVCWICAGWFDEIEKKKKEKKSR